LLRFALKFLSAEQNTNKCGQLLEIKRKT